MSLTTDSSTPQGRKITFIGYAGIQRHAIAVLTCPLHTTVTNLPCPTGSSHGSEPSLPSSRLSIVWAPALLQYRVMPSGKYLAGQDSSGEFSSFSHQPASQVTDANCLVERPAVSRDFFIHPLFAIPHSRDELSRTKPRSGAKHP